MLSTYRHDLPKRQGVKGADEADLVIKLCKSESIILSHCSRRCTLRSGLEAISAAVLVPIGV